MAERLGNIDAGTVFDRFHLTGCFESSKSKTMETTPSSLRLRASLAIFLNAAIWGAFWIPLRHMDENGLIALWAVVGISLAGSLIAIPIALYKREFNQDSLKNIIIVGISMGAANAFYFAGLILSDVVRVVFLFYLLPFWATLFSKLFFDVPISRARMAALGLALTGVWLLLGGGGWPLPQNIGDVFGILSGMGWAFGLTMMRGQQNTGPFASTASTLFFATVIALAIGIILHIVQPSVQPEPPSMDIIAVVWWQVLAFGIIVLWPSLLLQLWGAKYVAATTAALLTMSEILTATISTTLLGETNLAFISWMGAGLILCAIFIDIWANKDA